MASLFIKDSRTAALAEKVAEQLRTTKTDAVRRGLQSIEMTDSPGKAAPRGRTADWLRDYRTRRPLPDRAAMTIDKAFFDSLSDEEEDFGPWRP